MSDMLTAEERMVVERATDSPLKGLVYRLAERVRVAEAERDRLRECVGVGIVTNNAQAARICDLEIEQDAAVLVRNGVLAARDRHVRELEAELERLRGEWHQMRVRFAKLREAYAIADAALKEVEP